MASGQKMQKVIGWLSVFVMAVVLAGCGGGGGSSDPAPDDGDSAGGGSTTTYSVSGTAVDGLLQGVMVCIDDNANYACDAKEPLAITDSNGEFTFTGLSTNPVGKLLLVVAQASAPGNETGKPLVLLAKISGSGEKLNDQTVSPFTTVIDSGQMTEDELKAGLGLNGDGQNYNLRSVYTTGDDDKLYGFAGQLAQYMADQMNANLSASVSHADILKGDDGLLAKIAGVVKGNSQSLNPSNGLSNLLQEQKDLSVVVDYVDNVMVDVTLKSTSGEAIASADLLVKAYAYGENGVSASPASSEDGFAQVVAQTNAQGKVLVELPRYANTAKLDLHLTIEKAGYVVQEKVIKGVQNEDSVPLVATMTAALVEIFTVAEGDELNLGGAQSARAMSASGEPMLRFAVVKTPQGEKLIGGNAVAQAMASGDA